MVNRATLPMMERVGGSMKQGKTGESHSVRCQNEGQGVPLQKRLQSLFGTGDLFDEGFYSAEYWPFRDLTMRIVVLSFGAASEAAASKS